jgi:hypothetical protein
MHTIYDIAANLLEDLFYYFEENVDSILKEHNFMLNLLTSNNSRYEPIFKYIAKEYKDIPSYYLKQVMILIIASKAYIYNVYNLENGINSEYTEETIQILNDLNAKDIIELFKNHDTFAFKLIEDFFQYTSFNYIFKSISEYRILKSNERKSNLLKINPFEVLDNQKYKEVKSFLPSELIIQKFLDLYEMSENFMALDTYGEEENYETPEDFLTSVFVSNVTLTFSESEVEEFILYICANIYELLVINESNKKNPNKIYEFVKSYISESSKEELINDFLTDMQIASMLIEYFYDGNADLIDGELAKRREKLTNNPEALNKVSELNPFYTEEKRSFTRKYRQ